jgi:FG-GAP repeat
MLARPSSRVAGSRGSAGLLARGGVFSTRFARSGPVISVLGGSVGFRLSSLGYPGRLVSVSASTPRTTGDRVVYQRGDGVTEWYRNQPSGVEQGFTLQHRLLAGGGQAPLTIALTVSGSLVASLDRGTVVFSPPDARSQQLVRYGGLSVSDATGRRLRSRIELAGHRLLLVVAGAGARYPIRVDPLIQQGSKLAPAVGAEATGGEFGMSVSVSAVGNTATALVGSPADGTDGFNSGAAYVFTESNGVWTQEGGALLPNDEDNGDGGGTFGASVALSADGTTAVVGGPSDAGGVGAVWVFTESGGVWTQQGAKLTPSDAVGEALFGTSVSISGNPASILVGGPDDNGGQGAAWVFLNTAGVWAQQAKLDAGAGDCGVSVSLSMPAAMIGCPAADSFAGSASVFTVSGTRWLQEGPTLTGGGEIGEGEFGYSVSLVSSGDGSYALAGGPDDDGGLGAAWTFSAPGNSGDFSQQAELTGGGESGDGEFGSSVALNGNGGDVAVIGGMEDNGGEGAAWVFTQPEPNPSDTWTQAGAKQVGSGEDNSGGGGSFGASIASSQDGNVLMVGGPADAPSAGLSDGATWTLTLTGPGNTWMEKDRSSLRSGRVWRVSASRCPQTGTRLWWAGRT